jgi:hypothetical protein
VQAIDSEAKTHGVGTAGAWASSLPETVQQGDDARHGAGCAAANGDSAQERSGVLPSIPARIVMARCTGYARRVTLIDCRRPRSSSVVAGKS